MTPADPRSGDAGPPEPSSADRGAPERGARDRGPRKRDPGEPRLARPAARADASTPDPGTADAERVLGEAFRALVGGGGKPAGPLQPGSYGLLSRLSTAQVLLLAAIVGLALGMLAGLVSLGW